VPESASAATDLDLISYLRAISDQRMRRGIRFPACYLLLLAVLGIYCFSSRRLRPRRRLTPRAVARACATWIATPHGEGFAFAIRHHSVLTEALGLELRRPPSASSLRYFFLQVDVTAICSAIRDWTIAQISGGAADFDQIVCDGKTLRGSIAPTAGGGSTYGLRPTVSTLPR